MSKDSIIGVDQSLTQYWERIKEAYNNDKECGEFTRREVTQLKYRWNQIHPPVQNFNNCYKYEVTHKRSVSSEKDITADAHMIYSQDTGKKYEVKHA